MATFTISVRKYILPYTDTTKSIVEESCTDSTDTYPIGIQDTSPVTPSTIFLLKNYSGGTKKNLHIKNVSYTVDDIILPDSAFSIEYNGANLIDAVGTTIINIEGISNGSSIPNLQLVSNVTFGEIHTKIITFDYAIEDILGNVEQFTTTSICLKTIKCTTAPPPEVGGYCTAPFNCGTSTSTGHFFTVTLTEGENLYLRIHNTFRGLGNLSGIIRRYEEAGCTSSGRPYNVIAGFIQRDVGDYKYFIYDPVVETPYTSLDFTPYNVLHLHARMCLPRMYGDNASEDNVQVVDIDVMDGPGEDANVIYTLTLSETRPGI